MSKPADYYEEELELVKILKDQLDAKRYSQNADSALIEAIKNIVGSFEEITIKTPTIDIVIKWECPACHTDNETTEPYYNDGSWLGVCSFCELESDLQPV